MTATRLTAPRSAILLAAILIAAGPADAQRAPTSQKTVPQQATPEPPAAQEPPAKPDNPGLINELGKLLIKPADLFPSLKPATESAAPAVTQPGDTSVAPPAAATAPGKADAVPPVPAPAPSTTATAPSAAPPSAGLIPQVVRGRASCPVAANGAPDCQAGADKLCKEKGFAGGSSLDMDSAKTCSTKALLDGARHIRDICKTENFVIRAMCQ